MLRLIRAILWLALVGGIIYLVTAVPFGDRTLLQHVKAIASTRETRRMVKAVKAKARAVVERTVKRVASGKGGDAAGEEALTEDEREALRRVIRRKLGRSDGGGGG